MVTMELESGKCVVCETESKTRCSACSSVFYCSVEHQKSDWKTHKLICKAYKIAEDSKFGRFLVATRTIKAGEIVLKESPLIKGPSQLTGPVCVGCLEAVEEGKCSECEKCGWPVCKSECSKAADHQYECDFTQKRGSKISIQHFLTPHPTYQCVSTLRALLLKDKAPKKWEKLINLESHSEQRRGSDQWRSDRASIAQFIPRFYKCDNKWTEDEIMKVVGVLQINGQEVPLTEPPHVAVYNIASLVEHSCHPNISKSFTKSGDVIFWAPHEIKKDEHLSISYTDVVWGTNARLAHLEQTKMFKCECPRCLDPTEFETFYSAFKCTEHVDGYVLPKSFYDETEKWICSKCSKEYESKYIDNIRERAFKDFEAMQKDNPDQCKKYLDHYSKWLSNNHQHLTQVRILLAQLIGTGGPHVIQSISNKDLEFKVKLCTDLLTLLNIIAPAESRLHGSMRFELHAAYAELGRREAEKKNSNFRTALEESLYNAVECIRMLRHEPDVLPEGQIGIQAKNNAESLRTMLGIPKFSVPASSKS